MPSPVFFGILQFLTPLNEYAIIEQMILVDCQQGEAVLWYFRPICLSVLFCRLC